jgi:hypothetical protein
MTKQMLSEEFLKMQKLAGLITEAQYNQKISLIETQLNEDNLEVKRIAKQLYSWLKQNGVAVSLMTNPTEMNSFKKIGIKDPKQEEATIATFDNPSTKQTIIRVSLRGKESIVKGVENKLLTTYPGLEQFNKQQEKLYSGRLTNAREIPGAINLTFDLKEKTTAKGGLVGNTKTNQLNEALNKDIKAFGQDLDKNFKAAGFDTLVTFQSITPEQLNVIKTNPKAVVFEVYQNPETQMLTLRVNPKMITKAESIINKFQLSNYNGPVLSKGWTAKQVQGVINPGDIFKDDGNKDKGVWYFYRLAKVDTKVIQKN